jgi:hypothetical protein
MVLIVGAAAVYLWMARGRKVALCFAAVAAVVGGTLMVANTLHFGSPIQSAMQMHAARSTIREGVRPWDTPLWLGLYGTFLSPSRGLLVFSPVFLVCALGLWVGRRDPDRAAWISLTAAGWLAMAASLKWHWWWGGDAYGPRMSLDAIPYWTLLLIPAWRFAAERRSLVIAFVALALFSAIVQAAGAWCYDGRAWDERSAAESVNHHPERAVRWGDSQLLFYLRFPDTHPNASPGAEFAITRCARAS